MPLASTCRSGWPGRGLDRSRKDSPLVEMLGWTSGFAGPRGYKEIRTGCWAPAPENFTTHCDQADSSDSSSLTPTHTLPTPG